MRKLPVARQDEQLHEQILDAAVVELVATSIGSFSLDRVAMRIGVSAQTIRDTWPNSSELLNAALVRFGTQHIPIPDTGSLRGDLHAYAKSYAAMLNTSIGRRLVDSVMIKPQDWDLSGTRLAVLEKRYLRATIIIERGIERGECVAGIDPVRIIDMIGVGLCLPILFYDRPVDDEDCEFVVNTLLDGISTRP